MKSESRKYEINDIIHIAYGILYDLKNSGDYAQVETLHENVILVSVDELCVFWSKLCSVLYNEPQYQSIWHEWLCKFL